MVTYGQTAASANEANGDAPEAKGRSAFGKGCWWILGLFAAVIAILVASVAYAWLTFSFWPEVEPRAFDSAAWKAWNIETVREAGKARDWETMNLRYAMSADLVAKDSFKYLHVDELKSLLGEPNNDFLPEMGGEFGDWDVAYFIGMDFIDYVVLVLRLDDQDRVEELKLLMY